jgi:hypothetical protein
VGYTSFTGQPFAQKLVETTANNSHRLIASVTTIASPYTLSVYLKAVERQWAYLRIDRSGGTSSNAWFDLSSGTLGTAETGLIPAIQNIGNGWYRCSIIVDLALAGANNILVGVSTANNTTIYTGDGTSGIYIFGAQLSDSASVDPYVYNPVAAPTSTAYYGPRFDYDPVTLAPKGLLIEEQRTNLLLRSQALATSPWTPSQLTVTNNVTTAPDGTITANSAVESIPLSYHTNSQTYSLTAGTYALSVYAKVTGTGSTRYLTLASNSGASTFISAKFDLTTSTTYNYTSGGQTIISSSATSVGGGWYRCTVSFTVTATSSFSIALGNVTTAPPAGSYGLDFYTGDGISGLLLWGAQLEAGAFATSYIPTVASQVTRATDTASMTGTNLSSWYNQSEGTLLVEQARNNLNNAITSVYLTDGSNNNVSLQIFSNSTNAVQVAGITAGAVQYDLTVGSGITQGVFYKIASAYKTNSVAASLNGSAVVTDDTATIPTNISLFNIGAAPTTPLIRQQWFKSITYYPRRLTNAELQAITS